MTKIKHLIAKITPHIKLTTPVSIIISSIILSFGMVGYGYVTTMNNDATPRTMFAGHTIDTTDYVEGDAKSNVVVIEYSDPECPFCTLFHETIKQIRSDYKDKISFVYRNFPLTQIHPKAFDEARAISCAGKAGGKDGYYNYINAYFDLRVNTWKNSGSQQPPALSATGKEDIAKGLGFDMNIFNSCMNNNETEKAVNDSIADGMKALGDRAGTPTTFVLKKDRKGYEIIAKIEGAQNPELVKAAINQALANK